MSKQEGIDFSKSIVEETGLPKEAFSPMGNNGLNTIREIDLPEGTFKEADKNEIEIFHWLADSLIKRNK